MCIMFQVNLLETVSETVMTVTASLIWTSLSHLDLWD